LPWAQVARRATGWDGDGDGLLPWDGEGPEEGEVSASKWLRREEEGGRGRPEGCRACE
jgi:hypothetical protein